MAYKTAELEKQALTAIKKHKLIFIEEVASFLPCDKTTFYNHKLHEFDTLKSALLANKVNMKAGLRKKWYAGDNATTQIALYKLIGTNEEADRLNGKQKNETTVNFAPIAGTDAAILFLREAVQQVDAGEARRLLAEWKREGVTDAAKEIAIETVLEGGVYEAEE